MPKKLKGAKVILIFKKYDPLFIENYLPFNPKVGVVISTAAFHARVQGSVPGLGVLKETKNVSSPSTCESQYCGEPP